MSLRQKEHLKIDLRSPDPFLPLKGLRNLFESHEKKGVLQRPKVFTLTIFVVIFEKYESFEEVLMEIGGLVNYLFSIYFRL